ncbi:unnamed protein product, partial [Chrysoparadoxa australica]
MKDAEEEDKDTGSSQMTAQLSPPNEGADMGFGEGTSADYHQIAMPVTHASSKHRGAPSKRQSLTVEDGPASQGRGGEGSHTRSK